MSKELIYNKITVDLFAEASASMFNETGQYPAFIVVGTKVSKEISILAGIELEISSILGTPVHISPYNAKEGIYICKDNEIMWISRGGKHNFVARRSSKPIPSSNKPKSDFIVQDKITILELRMAKIEEMLRTLIDSINELR